jgi:hypothetical protein
MKQNIPHLYALRAFTVAAQSSSFSQAAELLNVTQAQSVAISARWKITSLASFLSVMGRR